MFIHPPGHHTPIRAILFYFFSISVDEFKIMSIGAYKSYDFQVSTEIHSYFQHSISLFLSLFSLHVIRVIGFGFFFLIRRKFCLFFRGAAFRNIFFKFQLY